MFRKGIEYDRTVGQGWNPFKRRYVMLVPYDFDFMGVKFTIPRGYSWDGPSSVPIIRYVTEGWLEPSLVHDYLYEFHFLLTQEHPFTQEDVDDLFLHDLAHNGVGWLPRFLVDKYYTKRVFRHFYLNAEPVKLSFVVVRDMLVAAVGTVAFLFLFFYFQSVIIEFLLSLVI